MKKLELWYPAKPFVINQMWGILNPIYKQFGFERHNGIDIRLGKDKKLRAPIKMKIIKQDIYPYGGGFQVTAVTTEKWVVPHLDDKEYHILFVFMHNRAFLHGIGDVLEVGDEVAAPDNTGFSTGAHTHIGAYRIEGREFVDKNDANNSFDFFPYLKGRLNNKSMEKWYESSSGSGLSLTIKGFAVGGLIPFVAVVAKTLGIELSELEITQLFDVVVASVSSLMIAVGLIGKAIRKIRARFAK